MQFELKLLLLHPSGPYFRLNSQWTGQRYAVCLSGNHKEQMNDFISGTRCT